MKAGLIHLFVLKEGASRWSIVTGFSSPTIILKLYQLLISESICDRVCGKDTYANFKYEHDNKCCFGETALARVFLLIFNKNPKIFFFLSARISKLLNFYPPIFEYAHLGPSGVKIMLKIIQLSKFSGWVNNH